MNNAEAIKLAIPKIKQFEAFKAKPYLDGAGVATIGYGTIRYPSGIRVTIHDDAITEGAAADYLMYEVNLKLKEISSHILGNPTNHQLAAMLSLAYNIGSVGFIGSSVLSKFNAGDIEGAAKSFLLWNKIRKGGQLVVSDGLTNRRKQEVEFFNTKD